MAIPDAAPKLLPMVLTALAALAVEGAAWWWVSSQNGRADVLPATLLGLLGMVLTVAAGAMLLRSSRLGARELQRAKVAAAQSMEHQRAMLQAQQEAEKARELLVTALDALPIGVAIFDQDDRQVIRNKCLSELFPGLFNSRLTDETYATIVHRVLNIGLLPDAAGREEERLAKRLAGSGDGGQPMLQRYTNDRWIHAYEVQTRQGYTVVARAEVTDLVRKEQLLAQANQQLSRQSATDALTGIANRRKFDETLASEWLRAARSGSALSLLMVDIDHFKRFNDHYGHVAGDECLRRVTLVLSACVRRAGELLARYGGEEFVMLLPGSRLDRAEEIAKRCLARIQKEALPHGSSPTASHVTFSIGVAHVIPDAAQDPDTLVNAADTAMYRAKMAGRAQHAVADLADWEIDKDAPRSRPGELT